MQVISNEQQIMAETWNKLKKKEKPASSQNLNF